MVLTIQEVRSAHADLKIILKPQQVTGKKDPYFDELFKSQLLGIKQFEGHWIVVSLATANSLMKSVYPEISHELHVHPQSIGKFVKAMDIQVVDFIDTPRMWLHSGLTK